MQRSKWWQQMISVAVYQNLTPPVTRNEEIKNWDTGSRNIGAIRNQCDCDLRVWVRLSVCVCVQWLKQWQHHRYRKWQGYLVKSVSCCGFSLLLLISKEFSKSSLIVSPVEAEDPSKYNNDNNNKSPNYYLSTSAEVLAVKCTSWIKSKSACSDVLLYYIITLLDCYH